MFSLPPLAAEPQTLPSLSTINPRFSLPQLDEDAPGVERLLGTLGRQSLPTWGRSEDVEVAKPAPPPPDAEKVEEGLKEKVAEDDIWMQASLAGPSKPLKKARTWDGLGGSLLSERPGMAFESLLVSLEPSLTIPKLRTSVAKAPSSAKELLQLMMRATLGTAMTDDLKWSRREGRFVYGETGSRPVGVERRTAKHLMDEFLAIGTGVRHLEIIIEQHAATPLTPTHHALLYALGTIMTLVKNRLAAAVSESAEKEDASWLHKSLALSELRELIEALCETMCWPVNQAKPVGLPARPSSVLTLLHGHFLARLSTSNATQQRGYVCLALAFLLSRTSEPFLDLLHQWIGLSDSSSKDDDEDPNSQPWADLGITRTQLPPAEGVGIRWDYSFSARRMPQFVPRDIRRTLFEAGRSLRALREASGGLHPLCMSDWPLRASWGWGGIEKSAPDVRNHTRRIQREIEKWRGSPDRRTRTLSSASASSLRSLRRRTPSIYTATPASSRPTTPSKEPQPDIDLWTLMGMPPGSHLPAANPTPLWTPTPLDELEAFVTYHSSPDHPLLSHDSPTLELYISSHLLAPLLAHSSLISRALISLYLDDLHFLDHLDVLRDFWLGGDAGFTERVGWALFGKDQAGAGESVGLGQRERTRQRLGIGRGTEQQTPTTSNSVGEWGIGLGVGLSDRARWPPGGSEMAYALRTTLLDDEVIGLAWKGEVWEGIEDRVSFAVRALPEDDEDGRRARWLNPQAIEALDFLYLSYSPPHTLSTLLPTRIMDKYQLIHNLLLRLARVDAVLRSLYLDTLKAEAPLDGEPVKTGIDAIYNRMPSKVGLPTRQRHSAFPVDSEADKTVLYLRFTMSWFVTSLTRYVIDTAIGQNWDLMRRRLDKLKKTTRAPATTDSRPATAAGNYEDDEYEDLDEEVLEADEGGDDQDEVTQLGALSQLQSAHSLVLYHHIILNRILRACLLSDKAGHQVTFKILMTLMNLILDLGKTVKEVERGVLGTDEGAERVRSIRQDWTDKQAVFLHALERLSLRSTTTPDEVAPDDGDEDAHDLQILLEGEHPNEDGGKHVPGSAELQELLLRLKLGVPPSRIGKWRE